MLFIFTSDYADNYVNGFYKINYKEVEVLLHTEQIISLQNSRLQN